MSFLNHPCHMRSLQYLLYQVFLDENSILHNITQQGPKTEHMGTPDVTFYVFVIILIKYSGALIFFNDDMLTYCRVKSIFNVKCRNPYCLSDRPCAFSTASRRLLCIIISRHLPIVSSNHIGLLHPIIWESAIF